ncbi:MAG: nucleotidyltransferase domain-containing protein [Bacteroidota bacterium]
MLNHHEQHDSSGESFEQELHNDILKTVAYFDLFEYPLTAEQIYSFLPRNSVTKEYVNASVQFLASKERLSYNGGFYFLPTANPVVTSERIDREARAKRMLSFARIVAAFIKQFPFVRGIFITGSLSKNVADRSSDIDFMIVTAPERLWIVRMMLTMFRKIFLLGSRKYFCTNYYVTEQGLTLDRRNTYTALEVVTTKVLWNKEAFLEYQKHNAWTKQFLPNISISVEDRLLISGSRSQLQRITESVLNLFPMRTLDAKLMDYHRTHWHKAFGHVGEERLRSMFIISKDISASWPEDRQVPVLTRYREKVAQLGLR